MANTRFAIVGFKAEFKDGFVIGKLVHNRKIRLLKSPPSQERGNVSGYYRKTEENSKT